MNTAELLKMLFSTSFTVYALIGGIAVALCAALLGVSLVLKRYSMIGDGLSHVGFGVMAVAMTVGVAPLALSIPTVIIAAIFLLRISERGIGGDAAIALISSSALAIGVIVISLGGGMNVDISDYMFGSSILTLTKGDVIISIVLAAVVIMLYIIMHNRIFAITFDEKFATATGNRSGLYNMIIAVLTAVTIVIGMRMIGALLISSLIIFPPLTAMRVCRSYRSVEICSVIVAAVCVVVGMLVSFVLSIPTGAAIVVTNLCVFIIFLAVSFIVRRIVRR